MFSTSVLLQEHIASLKDLQKHPSREVQGVTRVRHGRRTVGFFVSSEDFAEMLESAQAVVSKSFVNRIAKARQAVSSGKGKSLSRMLEKYGIGHGRDIYR